MIMMHGQTNLKNPNHYLLLSTALLGVGLEEIQNNKCKRKGVATSFFMVKGNSTVHKCKKTAKCLLS
jgi:hypothetical protein